MFTGHHVSNKWSCGESLCVYFDGVTYVNVNFYRTVTSGGSNRWCECWSPWDVDKRLDNELWWQWSWWLYDDDGWIQSNKTGEVHWASRNCMFFFQRFHSMNIGHCIHFEAVLMHVLYLYILCKTELCNGKSDISLLVIFHYIIMWSFGCWFIFAVCPRNVCHVFFCNLKYLNLFISWHSHLLNACIISHLTLVVLLHYLRTH